MSKIKVAVLISGRGTNLEALIEACKLDGFPAQINLVISNKKDASGINLAKKNNIQTTIIEHKSFPSREEFDNKLYKAILENNCQIVCLAGFMRVLTGSFVNKLEGRLINIHPSLLPSFKGANAVEDALKYGVKYSGCTVHYVTEEVDSGQIIDQEVVRVMEDDTKKDLASRILEKEHVIYPRALKKICNELINMSD